MKWIEWAQWNVTKVPFLFHNHTNLDFNAVCILLGNGGGGGGQVTKIYKVRRLLHIVKPRKGRERFLIDIHFPNNTHRIADTIIFIFFLLKSRKLWNNVFQEIFFNSFNDIVYAEADVLSGSKKWLMKFSFLSIAFHLLW